MSNTSRKLHHLSNISYKPIIFSFANKKIRTLGGDNFSRLDAFPTQQITLIDGLLSEALDVQRKNQRIRLIKNYFLSVVQQFYILSIYLFFSF